MKIKYHVISALPLGAGYYLLSGDMFESLAAVAAAIVVDVDHVVDYIVTQKRIDSFKEMAKAFETFRHINKNYFFLHSWEIVIVYGVILWFVPNRFALAVFSGYAFHVFMDQIYNVFFLGRYNLKGQFYFFIYRLTRDFDVFRLRQNGDQIDINAEIY